MKHYSEMFLMKQFLRKVLPLYFDLLLTLFRLGIFVTAQRLGGVGKKASLPKICHTDPTLIKLGTVIPYLKKIEKRSK